MKGELHTGYVTPCQLTVWKSVALGRSTKEIAYDLGVAFKTIDKHRTQLCRKLGAHSPADLTRKAIEHGVIPITVRPLTRLVIGTRELHILPTT